MDIESMRTRKTIDETPFSGARGFSFSTAHGWPRYELPDYYRFGVSQDDQKSYDCGFSDREIPILLAGEKNSIVALADICAD